jgi:hypothetical protein
MALDQLVIPDMTELYYAGVRAVEYSEPSNKHPSDSSAGALRGACLPKFSHTKPFHRTGMGAFQAGCKTFLAILRFLCRGGKREKQIDQAPHH